MTRHHRQGAAFARLSAARWHFQHGPIDLVVDVDACAEIAERCIADCWRAFQSILSGLVAELPALRRPASERVPLRGPVARRMAMACEPFADDVFITPMAAVAGAVADELIAVFRRTGVIRASINNGGDIAFHVARGASYTVGVWSQIDKPPQHDLAQAGAARGGLDGRFVVDDAMPVRGIATSGWRGRSFSLGIADSVTVLARTAAEADAAATLIANSVTCDAVGIVRAPASQLKDDSDLGDRLVTVDVPALTAASKASALSSGRLHAEALRDRGLIHAAALFLQGAAEVVQPRAPEPLAGQTRAVAATTMRGCIAAFA